MRRVERFCLILLICVSLLLIIRFSLQFIPGWTVSEVVVSGATLPDASLSLLKELYGKPIFSFTAPSLKKRLEKDPLVRSVKLDRKLPGRLNVEASLIQADALLLTQEGGECALVSGDKVISVKSGDEKIFPQSVIRVVVPSSYLRFLTKFGVPSSFHDVLSMLSSLSDGTSLITKIKYDNNSNDNFGNVVVELAGLHAQLSVREAISASVFQKALQVVVADQEGTVPLKGEVTCYDVYASGMVRR